MDNKENPQDNQASNAGTENEENSLENIAKESGSEASPSNTLSSTPAASSPGSKPPGTGQDNTVEVKKVANPNPAPDFKQKAWHRLLGRFNLYIFFLVIIIMVSVIVIIIGFLSSQNGNSPSNEQSQNLSASALQQLANGDTNVGSSGEVLNVESSAVFAGNILARQSLQVAGNITVGGTIAISDLTVSGTGQIGQLQVGRNLSVTGDSNLQGNLSVGKSLQVSSGGNFGGTLSAPQVTTTSLQLNGNLVLTHHISIGGPSPTSRDGSALGGGGTASVSGSDTSGSITINTGDSPSSGCFITITFNQAFNSTPHILITPVGQSAAGLGYYITRTTTNFSVCAENAQGSTAIPSNSSFGFDYLVLD